TGQRPVACSLRSPLPPFEHHKNPRFLGHQKSHRIFKCAQHTTTNHQSQIGGMLTYQTILILRDASLKEKKNFFLKKLNINLT
ncbi:MAG: hypothetical protein KKD17_02230, partial [Nanoarchaeota archaeon]|nr:hypothetical protein [Nanoarchaeota archaeon]